MQTGMGIHIFPLLSESYIQKKHSADSVRKNYTELITFIFLAQESININNIKIKFYKKGTRERKILLMAESKRFALMKSYLLRR